MKYSRKKHPRREESKDCAVRLGRFIAEQKATVRSAAAVLAVSKSTVHKDITCRLERSDPALFHEVSLVLEKNKSERHLRGGNATKLKYARQNEQKKQIKLCNMHIKT